MSTVSLCLIVKNEEKVLSRCLESIKNIIDEIIIVDTGSNDNTKNIASCHTDKIYDFTWINDFSAARNFSFSKASGEYIMWMDADDIFPGDNIEEFIKLKNNNFNDEDVVMMPYITAFDEDNNPSFLYYRERIVKRSTGPLWEGRVHEVISHSSSKIMYSKIPIIHKSIKTKYSDRNLKIYENQISEGVPLSPRDIFYYGRELFYHRRYRESIACLKDFLNISEGWMENKIEACKILSYAHTALKDRQSALSALLGSFAYDIPRADICCEAGNIFMESKNYKTAIFWYELALKLPVNEMSGAFISKDYYGYIPCIQLCVCYDFLGNHRKAKKYNELAGKIRPHSKAYLFNLEYFKKLSDK